MADSSTSKLRPENRYHSILSTSTQNPDEERAHVLYYVNNVKRGIGMAKTLRDGFRQFATRLERPDLIIGQDNSPEPGGAGSQKAPKLI